MSAPQFRFVEFNPRRALRGADAARVAVVDEDGEEDWLWMSKSDLKKNIKLFGMEAVMIKHEYGHLTDRQTEDRNGLHCDGGCDARNERSPEEEACSGEVRRVRVINGAHDWGEFNYCDTAVRLDRDMGFSVSDVSQGEEIES